jgi:Spy/CpxP family protein refolding chaperone
VAWELQGYATLFDTMITIRQNLVHSLARLSQNNLFQGAFVSASALVLSSALSAQTPAATDTQTPAPAPSDNPSPAPADNQNGGRGNRGNRGNFSPEEMRARMSAALKEQFGVTSDDEWNLIMERINKVNELRRSTMMGGMGLRVLMGTMGGFGGPGGQNAQGGRSNRQGDFGAASNPEAEALQTAVTDKAPDAEIKARLEHLREVRKTNETNLAKAQEDLRAVLSVRQEAVAVLVGLLP